MNWDQYFLKLISIIKKKSKDPHTNFGAVIVGPDHEIRSTGFNSPPRGVNDNITRRKYRPEKYLWMVHAESNAIFNAARVGIPCKGCTIYINGLPCTECAKAIIQAGIIEVKYNKKEWKKFLEGKDITTGWLSVLDRSLLMLNEAGVEINAI